MDSDKPTGAENSPQSQPPAENVIGGDAGTWSEFPENPPSRAAEADEAAPRAAPATAAVPFKRTAEAPKVEPPQREPSNAARAPSRGARFGLLAASIALAAGIGAAAGAASFAGVNRLTQNPAPAPVAHDAPQRAAAAAESKALKDAIAQLRGSVRALSESVATLRSQVDSAGKGVQAQFTKMNEGIERLERAHAEPAARVAKLAEAIERLERRSAPAAAAPFADVTGSTKPPPLPPLGNEPRPAKPVLDGWTVRDVDRGVALVEGRVGSFEVIVGDDIRGAGRVQDIRRQDGRWVVITSRGMIMHR